MSLFADSLRELKYEQGIVSFRLHHASSDERGDYIHIPFEDFRAIAAFLIVEVQSILPVHSAWLQEQINLHAEVKQQVVCSTPRLGKKIGSI